MPVMVKLLPHLEKQISTIESMGKFLLFAVLFIFFLLLIPALVGPSPPEAVLAQNAAQGVAAACGASYTVVAGDTLYEIAQRCGVSYSALWAANTWLGNPDRIYPGQVLAVPGSGPGIPPTGGQTYVVVSGDRLYRIAQRFGTTVEALVAANPTITNPDVIFPGQVLVIPGAGPGIPPTGGQTYTVLSGDTLYSIATRYNRTVAQLQTANPWITNVDRIYPGWVIVIP